MSEQKQDQDHTDLDELNPEGVGAGATPEAPSTFEPEEPEHPDDDK